MRWPDWLLVSTGVQYVAASIGYWRMGDRGHALAFAGYSIANVGLIWAAIAAR